MQTRTLLPSVLIALGLVTSMTLFSQSAELDLAFDPGTGANGTVNAMALREDGRVLIVGSFAGYNGAPRNGIAGLTATGALDGTFDPGTGADGPVNAVAVQTDGKVLIGGDFNIVDGNGRNRIARLNTDGSVDMGFLPLLGANGTVRDIALQADGKILIAGDFTEYQEVPRNRIARLNEDGSLDLTFDVGSGANNIVYALAVQEDGKILIAGDFTNYREVGLSRIARINPDGTVDLGFAPGAGANEAVRDMVIDAAGRIVIGGEFTFYGGLMRNRIARVNTNGTLDGGFNPGMGTDGDVRTLQLQDDGKVLVGGLFTVFAGVDRDHVVRLTTGGLVDVTFDPGDGANNNVLGSAIQEDQRMLICGEFTIYDGTTRNGVARLGGVGCVIGSPCDDGDPCTIDDVFDAGCNCVGTFEDSDGDGVCDAEDDCPLVVGQVGSPCDDGNPVTSGDTLNEACECVGVIECTFTISLEITLDQFGSQTTWELYDADAVNLIYFGGPYPDGEPGSVVVEELCLPAQCYRLFVNDDAANGIENGGYILRDGVGRRIIDADGAFEAVSTIGEAFCLPLSNQKLIDSWCDRLDLVNNPATQIYASFQPGATGYQFWIFDPHGSYSRRVFRPQQNLLINALLNNPVPADIDLNVRVRALVGGNYTPFGRVCKIRQNTVPGAEQRSAEVVQEAFSMELYPNPNRGESVFLTMKGLADTEQRIDLDIYDLLGKRVHAEQVTVAGTRHDHVIALGDRLQTGIYLVNVRIGETLHTMRMVRH